MKVSDVLIKAKSYIQTPEQWTQGTFARKPGNEETTWLDASATCFCSLGAIYKATTATPEYIKKIEVAAAETLRMFIDDPKSTVHQFNDRSTHGQVMEAFDKAINYSLELEKSNPARSVYDESF